MKVAGHGAADANPPSGLLPSIRANILAPVSPAHDAVHRAGILDAHLPRHGATLPKTSATVKDQSRGLTPFAAVQFTDYYAPLYSERFYRAVEVSRGP